tara:strand:- start:541 stop:936 length:396 start_codon:yes stop_codon:yes gene_type:complete
MNTFHLDIITPISCKTYDNVSYLRVPALDGLLGIKANHANAIIALDVGEVKVEINGQTLYFATSGGYTDIQSKGVQLLLESIEKANTIDKNRAKQSLDKAQKRIQDKSMNLIRAQHSLMRAKNRLSIINKK